MGRKKLGEMLIERGIIDEDQLNSALAYQRQWGHRLGVALVAKGFITEGMLARVLGEVMGLPTVDLAKIPVDTHAIRMVPINLCVNNDLIPISLEEKKGSRVLTVAMSDPLNIAVIDEIEFTTGCKVKPVMAMISAINSAIRKYYRGQNTEIKPLSSVIDRGRDTSRMQLVRPGGDVEEVDTNTYTGPDEVMNLVDEIDQAGRSADDDDESEPSNIHNQVSQIKARRSQRLAKQSTPPPAQAPDPRRISTEEAMQDYLKEVQTAEVESLQKLEKYFWALMRVMAKKGFVTKDEFLKELDE